MKDGWREHVPLTLLTTDYLKSLEAAKKLKAPVCLSADGKGVEVLATANNGLVSPKDEASLSLQEWLQVWDQFLDLIDEYLPRSRKARENHWKMVWQHRDRDSKWHCLLRYCIEVRRAAMKANFDPGTWQEHIWHTVVDEDRDRIAAGRSIPGQGIPYTPRDHNAATSQSSQRRSGPFNSSEQKPTKKPRNGHEGDKCFRCGTFGHAIRECRKSEQYNGRPIIVIKSGPAWTINDKPFCYRFNTAKGCTLSPAPTHPTYAHFAKHPTTAPKAAGHDPRRVTTPLLPDKWESELRALGLWEEFGDVPTGLREGFRIGASSPVRETYTPQNHKSALDRPKVIEDHIKAETAAGRYTGPYSCSSLQALIGLFRSVPLGVVDKPSAPGKYRIMQDFSFPRDSPSILSLNSQINSDDFACTWGFFADVAEAIARVAPGARGATFDVDAAYRQIPVHPIDQPHIVFRWGDLYWVDGRVPFGAASSNGLFGRCRDAIAAIYTKRGFSLIFKWVDDFLFIQVPDAMAAGADQVTLFSEEAIYALAARLGWPWKEAKTRLFAPIFVYLSFEWCIHEKWVRIPQGKRKKYLNRALDWLKVKSPSLKETEVLVGMLIHCALAVPEGRPHLAGIIAYKSGFPRMHNLQFIRKPPSEDARKDVQWWADRLTRDDCGSSLAPPPPPSPWSIYTDASSSFSLGVVIDDSFLAWRLMQGWKKDGRDIGWAEAIAVELAIEWAISHGARNTTLKINCDNQGFILAWKAERSRNRHQNDAIIRIIARCMPLNIHVSLVYVNTKDNPADFPSRNKRAPSKYQANIHPTIPAHLSDFVVNAVFL